MKKTLLIAALGIALMAPACAAFAQDNNNDNDLQPLLDRVGRLEQDMSILQRQVYRRGDDGGRAPAGPGANAGDAAGYDQLSDQMRELTGRIEEVRHDVDALRQRIEKITSDTEMRLQALEHGNGAAGGPNTAMNNPDQREQAPVLTPPPPRRNGRQQQQNLQGGSNEPPPDDQTAAAGPDTGPPPPTAGTLPNGTPQQQYDYAFGLLRDANYDGAERALKSFVTRYPTNRLASNAQYWLGETYFVRGRYQAAAAVFAEGYQKYPKGPKAADDLLKLGSALAMLNRKADACRSFAQLDRDFPIAAANLKAKEVEEKRKAGCR